MSDHCGSVTVIVPAFNASLTIERAIASALQHPEVGLVVVVDDASTDATAATAAGAGGGDDRLVILQNQKNLGPSASRNRALAQGSSPFVALLDSDDFYLPGRFRHLLQRNDFDFIADNVVFVAEEAADDLDTASIVQPFPMQSWLTAKTFITENTKSGAVRRSELGFIKPVMRRDAFDRFGLAYAEEVRLGEDFVLYTKALARGARFMLDRHCGYVATVRASSLSGQHRTSDLKAQLDADAVMLREESFDPSTIVALKAHQRAIWKKYVLRQLLDDKRERGLVFAALQRLRVPSSLWPAFGGVLADKLRPSAVGEARDPSPTALRYLFDLSMPGIIIEEASSAGADPSPPH